MLAAFRDSVVVDATQAYDDEVDYIPLFNAFREWALVNQTSYEGEKEFSMLLASCREARVTYEGLFRYHQHEFHPVDEEAWVETPYLSLIHI